MKEKDIKIRQSSLLCAMISYTSDQAGDATSAVQLGGSCVLSGQGSKAIFVAGAPCSGSTPLGDNNSLEVEVWGHYTCNSIVVPGGASINITGSFDGIKKRIDSCYGSGGSGGVVPINL